MTVNGLLDVGATNLTIGGRDLQTDVRAVRNASCIINGGLRIAGDWSHQFKVYGHVKFNTGSTKHWSKGLHFLYLTTIEGKTMFYKFVKN